jgi:hypothetical protein
MIWCRWDNECRFVYFQCVAAFEDSSTVKMLLSTVRFFLKWKRKYALKVYAILNFIHNLIHLKNVLILILPVTLLTLILLMWRIGRAPNSIPVYEYIKQDATLHSLFISGYCTTCFGWYFHPSSEAHTPVSTASGICHTVTAICRYQLEPVW